MQSRQHGLRRLSTAALLAVLPVTILLVATTILRGPWNSEHIASAEDILHSAESAAASPNAAGVRTLIATQELVMYSLGNAAGVPTARGVTRTWYEAPKRQRIETEFTQLAPDGSVASESSSVTVWDGTDTWTHDTLRNVTHVHRQDPDGKVFGLAATSGSVSRDASEFGASACRDSTVLDDDTVAGREAYVLELGRPRCGLRLPGSDGRTLVTVDKQTGMVLRSAQFAAGGQLFASSEVTSLEVNDPIAEDRLRFTPTGGAVEDYREQSSGDFAVMQLAQPPSISLDAARNATTFPVRVPARLPEAYTLESVEHYWPPHVGAEARAARSVTADWLLLRYVDPAGNWLVITQGYGGLLGGLAFAAPDDLPHGTVTVQGKEARWLDGTPGVQWEPGGMITLTWEVGRFGPGWNIGPSGEPQTGSPLSIALASNVLTLDELIAVAESLG